MLGNFPLFHEDARFQVCEALLCWYLMICAVFSFVRRCSGSREFNFCDFPRLRQQKSRGADFAQMLAWICRNCWLSHFPRSPCVKTTGSVSPRAHLEHNIAALHTTSYHWTTLHTITALHYSTSQCTTLHKISPWFICQNGFICHFLVKRLTELGGPGEIVYCLFQFATSY